ncbi:hypothetical protein F5Y04DRAFT_246878 [Hypomontagnella monticulosa]|nr:hypothetical protein F5Y04DRAFT_246878 [Hypomontagnella monticulosa]
MMSVAGMHGPPPQSHQRTLVHHLSTIHQISASHTLSNLNTYEKSPYHTWTPFLIRTQPPNMSYPHYEAELDRASFTSCLRIFRHPSEAPSLLRSCWHDTRDYYAARDVVELERGELIQIVSYSRRLALKMTGSALFLGLLVVLAVLRTCKDK